MNIQELAAKVTGVDAKLDSLRTDLEKTQAENKTLAERLQTAEEKAATTSEHADALTDANEQLQTDLTQAQADLKAANEKINSLENEAQTVAEAASAEAVEIVATQGADAEAAAHAEEAGGAGTGQTVESLMAQMQALPVAERHAFYQKNRDKLNPFK